MLRDLPEHIKLSPGRLEITADSAVMMLESLTLLAQAVQSGQRDLVVRLLCVLVAVCEVIRNFLKKTVVEVDEQAKENAHLNGVESCWRFFEDALEGSLTGFQNLASAVVLGLDLRLLPLELLFALLLPALPLFFVLRSLPRERIYSRAYESLSKIGVIQLPEDPRLRSPRAWIQDEPQ
jgi:hypothetical protein